MSEGQSLSYPYTLGRLVSETLVQLPRLVRAKRHVMPGLVGRDRVDGKTRLLAQLRMARLMGCPVCVGMFPPIARRSGLGDEAIRSGLEGRADGLTAGQFGAITWVGELVAHDGEPPSQIPEAALALTRPQREHLLFCVRMELVVHATGLLFLPHAWVQRARQG